MEEDMVKLRKIVKYKIIKYSVIQLVYLYYDDGIACDHDDYAMQCVSIKIIMVLLKFTV